MKVVYQSVRGWRREILEPLGFRVLTGQTVERQTYSKARTTKKICRKMLEKENKGEDVGSNQRRQKSIAPSHPSVLGLSAKGSFFLPTDVCLR